MDNLILKLLITTLTAAAIGYSTSLLVDDVTRLRRRASRRKTEQLILAANINNSYFGLTKDLIL